MKYEEKYKEALKVIESLYNVVKYQSSSDALLTCQTIEKAFPELRESEDESKKWILEYLYDGLRKSDEQFKGQFKTAIDWLEKQGEQKPTWSEEDEKIINTIISDVTRTRTSCGIGTEEYNIRLKALNWLKSLKLQQKQEWDNKDDGILNCLIATLCEEEHGGIKTNKRFVDWLKSLKPNHWKPSKYDISLLEEIARNIRHNVRPFCSEVSSLENLIDNLKKL